MPRIYVYKLTTDDGGAPCIAKGLLSLCICKPRIRSTARKEDFLIGVAANSLDPHNHLIYVARITDKKTSGAYFREPQYRDRADCIYAWRDGGYVERAGARYHGSPNDLKHDLGPPPDYARANTLLSRDFRYFGDEGTADYKRLFPRVARLVATLGRGHRVNHSLALEGELLALIDWGFTLKGRTSSANVANGSRCRPCRPPPSRIRKSSRVC